MAICLTGILCKHALKVLNTNNIFILPTQYILGRWTKYAKRGFYVDKQETMTESNKTWAARISRFATSIALKCSQSRELLHDLEKSMRKLDLEADASLSKMEEKSDEVPLVSPGCGMDPLKDRISFRIPKVIKGPKKKRVTNILEKSKGKKTKSAKKKKNGILILSFSTSFYFQRCYFCSKFSYFHFCVQEIQIRLPKIEMKVLIRAK